MKTGLNILLAQVLLLPPLSLGAWRGGEGEASLTDKCVGVKLSELSAQEQRVMPDPVTKTN